MEIDYGINRWYQFDISRILSDMLEICRFGPFTGKLKSKVNPSLWFYSRRRRVLCSARQCLRGWYRFIWCYISVTNLRRLFIMFLFNGCNMTYISPITYHGACHSIVIVESAWWLLGVWRLFGHDSCNHRDVVDWSKCIRNARRDKSILLKMRQKAGDRESGNGIQDANYVSQWTVPSLVLIIAHDDVMKWKRLPRHCPFVWGIHRWTMDSPLPIQMVSSTGFDVLFDVKLNKLFNKQSNRWWLGTTRRSLDITYMISSVRRQCIIWMVIVN